MMAAKTLIDLLRDDIQKTQRELIDALKDTARKLYRQVYDDNQILDSNLEYWVTGEGEETDTRGSEDLSPEDEEKLNEIERLVVRLYEVYKENNDLTETYVLFINAPFETRSRRMPEDKEANSMQNTEVFRLMYPNEEEQEQVPSFQITVPSHDEMMQKIKETLDEVAQTTKSLIIVFNGEGKLHNGTPHLRFHKGPEMSMSQFKEEFLRVWTDSIKKQAIEDVTEADTSVPSSTTQNDSSPGMEADTSVPNSTAQNDSSPGMEASSCESHLAMEAVPSTSILNPIAQDDSPMNVDTSHDDQTMDEGASTAVQRESSLIDYSGILDEIPPMPSLVMVIFAQCYGCFFKGDQHHASNWDSQLRFVPLSQADVLKGQTRCTYKFDYPKKRRGFKRRLLWSHHEQLEDWAKNYAQERALGDDTQ